MDPADVLRQCDTSDEDLKVAQVPGMRTFNALGASLKLPLSGYSALILRDVLETVSVLDLFAGDRNLIERWRLARFQVALSGLSLGNSSHQGLIQWTSDYIRRRRR